MQAVVLNTTMALNSASLGGAVGLQRNASLALHNCSLEANTAVGGPAGGGSGGSVYAAACNWLLVGRPPGVGAGARCA